MKVKQARTHLSAGYVDRTKTVIIIVKIDYNALEPPPHSHHPHHPHNPFFDDNQHSHMSHSHWPSLPGDLDSISPSMYKYLDFYVSL